MSGHAGVLAWAELGLLQQTLSTSFLVRLHIAS
jgi:hypothetical protein